MTAVFLSLQENVCLLTRDSCLDSWIVHSLPLGAPLQAAGEAGQDPDLLQAAQLCARGLQADHEGPRRRKGRRAEEDEDSEGRATGM